MRAKGKVYIVGAGPGDPELITLKGMKVIREADTILYDRLIPKELLKKAKPDAEIIYVGKEGGKHTFTQDEINELLAKKALEGKVVVRLKGGDPYVFGRGEEECEYLISHGVECEVIPGVTSATAVPAYAGIPVTNRYLSSSFIVITGKEAKDKEVKRVRIEDLASVTDTIVILMGISNIKEIVYKLLNVLPSSKPIAVIMKGTTKEQLVVVGTLENILEKVNESCIKPPAIVIVGEVVKFRDKLWKLS